MSSRSPRPAETAGRRAAHAWFAGGVLALLLLAGCGAQDAGTPAAAPMSPTEGGSASSGPSPAAEAERVGSVVPEDPRTVVLPGGGAIPVRPVSTTANGVLDVPTHVDAAGWWRGGSRLGDPFGSTLLAAHVDSETEGLGPFARLLRVTEGQRILLRSESFDQTFRVRSLELVPRGSIAADSPLHSPDGERRLTLVTCAGPFDPDRGGYQNLAVVVATPAGPPRERQDR